MFGIIILLILLCREMFHGCRWLHYLFPHACGNVFVKDFVLYNNEPHMNMGHILKYFYKVCIYSFLSLSCSQVVCM